MSSVYFNSTYDLTSYKSKNITVYAFDLDWTLIRPTKGLFPKNDVDWKLLPNRLERLKLLSTPDNIIVIFSNQSRNINMVLLRIKNVQEYLKKQNIDTMFFVSLKKDEYRKPLPGMFHLLTNLLSSNNITIDNKYYCGDADGSPDAFSRDDIDFSKSTGMSFIYIDGMFLTNIFNQYFTKTLIIFVGCPGSGKSYYYDKYLQPVGYKVLHQDILKTKERMWKQTEILMKTGESIVVDATNPSKKHRQPYLNLIKKYKYKGLIIYFSRDGNIRNSKRQHKVPPIALSMYYKNFEEPDETEEIPVMEHI